jgi:hypothetical protein
MKKILLGIQLLLSLQTLCQCYPDRHSTSWNDAWYSCTAQPNPNPDRGQGHWILYDLRHTYLLGKGKVWNLNVPGRLQDGFREFAVDYSQDGEKWKSLGDFILPQGPGDPLYEGEEVFDFAADTARYVLYTALSNYGGECYGLSEMKIDVIDLVSETGTEADGCLWLSVRPNPHRSAFTVDAGSTCDGTMEYLFADPTGRILKRATVHESGMNAHEINTSDLAKGIYYLILSQNGERVVRRVVKIGN